MELTRIAIDAMGGDNAPQAMVEGALWALKENDGIHLSLVGDEDRIAEVLKGKDYNKERLEIVHAEENISNDESPVLAIRRKKNSSLVIGLNMVKEKKVEAIVSAGSTGAVLAGGTLIVGRIKGIERPALGSLLPTEKGMTLLIDCGANVDSKPFYLQQFAKMGSVYYEAIMEKPNPTIGLLNNGEEAKKGNNLTKETYKLLKDDPHLNFTGNVEGREISQGQADVLVCDGFVGNVVLKLYEGVGRTLMTWIREAIMSTFISKIGGALIRNSLKDLRKKMDYTEYGGAPLLGLEGLVVKSHGSSDAKAFMNAIKQCKTFADKKVNDKIKQQLLD